MIRRVCGAVVTMVLVLIALVLATVVTGELIGFRAVAIETSSMTPTLLPGYVVISQSVDALDVRPGDVITFRDPSLGQQLVTHRVVQMHEQGEVVAFVTKGDTNRVPERWSVSRSGRVGIERAVIPNRRAAVALVALTGPAGRVAEAATIVLLAGLLALRHVWRQPRRS